MKPVMLDVVLATPLPSALRSRRTDAASEAKRLAADIERAIRVRTGRTIHDLHVTVTNQGIILLSGNCSTYYTKQLAQHAAMTLLADEKLMNNIEVV